jgi:ElaB/YqjD/DUF883 family membrane-anchored ribosome-binding protein
MSEEYTMSASVQGDTDRVRDDLRTAADDSQELLRTTSAQANARIQQARDRAQVALQRARHRLTELESQATRRAQDVRNATEGYVRENPWQAVLAAAGVGLALGIVVSLGRRR